MTALVDRVAGRAELVLAYHQRTKHTLERYAARPASIDWTSQPNPFREFAGSPRTVLPLRAHELRTSLSEVYRPGGVPPRPFSRESVGMLLQLSLGLSAWKEHGPDRWSLRCNPSSGNLHPTEAYVLCQGIDDLENGLYHYLSRDHVLERRCVLAAPSSAPGLWIGLTSVYWREAWKYGERAFRYCQLDIGHALGTLRYAAAVLGWQVRLVPSLDDEALERLFGLDRDQDFAAAERESADLLLEVTPSGRSPAGEGRPPPKELGQSEWTGRANVLDPHPLFHWPVIDEVSRASQPTAAAGEAALLTAQPPLCHPSDKALAPVILQRRSAERYDSRHTMPARDFYHLLDCLLPRSAVPWDVWEFTPRIHPVFFVHRVAGLEPGLYVLVRRTEVKTALRSQSADSFVWHRPASAPPHLPFYQLVRASCGRAARTISCHQALTADCCFSLSMLSEFESVIRRDAWRYRQLHWEAGLLGQVLYLEAEAAALRGTGIGCYFDDLMHDILGLKGMALQSLYHFTVGQALTDERILTLPPYPQTMSLS